MKPERALILLIGFLLSFQNLHAQTPAEIPPGMVGWWRLENNGGDALGFNHGALANSVSFVAGGPAIHH